MPSEREHLKEAKENQKFSQSVDNNLSSNSNSGKINNWVIIAEFYTAVHYIDAVLDRSGYHPDDHGKRFDYIQSRNAFSNKAESVYQSIYDLSIQSRYECTNMYTSQVNSARQCVSILESELPNIP